MEKITGKIKAISVKKKAEGEIGVLIEDQKWHNVHAEESVLNEMLKTIIQKGNIISFDFQNGLCTNFTLIEKSKDEDGDLLSLDDLLKSAHEKFGDNLNIKTKLISHDPKEKSAVFKARVIIADGSLERDFDGHGDADQNNCGEMVKKHYLRMAETRAICRALRWATNNAQVAEEEMEDTKGKEPSEEDMSKP